MVGRASAGDAYDAVATHPVLLTRRQVLFGFGALVGAAALAGSPLWREMAGSLGRAARPAVGVVAPPSTRYPFLLDELVTGVRAGLASAGLAETPVFSSTAHNAAPSGVAQAARTLVERDRVDTVLVYGNPTRTAELETLVQETGAAVVIVDPGAQIVTTADASTRVLAHSLAHWQSVWALGAWAGATAQGSARIHAIASMYDSGFDTLAAFEHGLSTQGGRIVGTSLTHVRDGDVARAVERAMASGAQALFVAASGDEAVTILRAIAADPAASRLQLLVPGLAVSQFAGIAGLSGHTALAWPASATSPFTMLGHDVATLIAAAVSGGVGELPAGKGAHEGARGPMTVDLARGTTDVPVRIHRIASGAGAPALEPLDAVFDTAQATALADQIVYEPRTGWLDVYGGAQ